MTKIKLSPMKKALIEFKRLRHRACRRDSLYSYLAGKYHLKPSSIRSAVSRAHLTDKATSLKHIFSIKEEEALVEVCIRQSRLYRPFTVPEFQNVAREFAGSLKKRRKLGRKFVYCFMMRHRKVLHTKKGKLTSPTRNSHNTYAKTQAFIDKMNRSIQSNRINSHNIVVFDETVIGDSVTVPVVIGERRNSGGCNMNYAQTRYARLACFIPFSMPDGTTPFRVYIFKNEDVAKENGKFEVLAPSQQEAKEKGYGIEPIRLYLSSDTGFLNKSLFRYIIIRFAQWWKISHGLVDCFMICDNLPVHANNDIRALAKSLGIHIFYIMPGTSHWFQVHDQQPFGALKKKMTEEKFKVWTPTAAPFENNVDLLTCLFYQAEKHGLEASMLRQTFADVGLWPWNPAIILQNCQENCLVLSPGKESRLVRKLLQIINTIDEKKRRQMQQMIDEMKVERVITQAELVEKMAFEEKLLKKLFGVKAPKKVRKTVEIRNIAVEVPAEPVCCIKRGRGRPRKNSMVH